MITRSGKLIKDEVWCDEVMLEGDVIVPSGIVLRILPGTSITFSPIAKNTMIGQFMSFIHPGMRKYMKEDKCHLIVTGVVDMEGEEERRIVIGNEGWAGSILLFRNTIGSKIRYCHVEGAAVGLFVCGEAPHTVTGSVFVRNQWGMAALHRRFQQEQRGEFPLAGNTFSDNERGMFCTFNNARITHNTITDNRLLGLSVRGEGSIVSHNTFIANGVHIKANNCQQLQIVDNAISEGRIGINNRSGDGIVLNGNTISDCTTGVYCQDTAETSIGDNTITGGKDGITVSGRSHCRVTENRIQATSKTAIFVYGMSKGIIEGNYLDRVDSGIRCGEDSQMQVRKNTVRSSGNSIAVYGIGCIEATENKIESVNGSCFVLNDAANGDIRDNECAGLRGTVTWGLSFARVENNRIRYRETGVLFRDDSSGMVMDNEIEAMSAEAQDRGIVDSSNGCLRNERNTLLPPEGKRNVACGREPHWGEVKKRTVTARSSCRIRCQGIGRILVQRMVLATWHYPFLGPIYRKMYGVAVRNCIEVFKNCAGVKTVYLRRGLTMADWIPGSSDIDMLLVIESLPLAEEQALLTAIGDRYDMLKKRFPFLGEMQIGTDSEVTAYLRYGDLRAFEAPNSWKLLFGEPLTMSLYEYHSWKYRMDAVVEVLHSFRILSHVYFERDTFANGRILFIKMFCNILKYCLLLREEQPLSRSWESRDALLATLIEQCANATDRALLEAIRGSWRNNRRLPESLFRQAYLFICRELEKTFDDDCDLVPRPVSEDRNGPFSVLPAVRKAVEVHDMDAWEELCMQLQNVGAPLLQGLIYDMPGMLYLVTENHCSGDAAFIEKMKSVRKIIRAQEYLRHISIMPLTRNMFKILQHSLHLESPFNYYLLMDTGNRCAMMVTEHGRKHQWGVTRQTMGAPSADHLHLLMREAAVNSSLSLRMFEMTWRGDNRYQLSYLCERFLALRLAMEKGVIVEPDVDTLLDVYRHHFSEHRVLIERVAAYIALPDDALEALDSREIFHECYPLFRAISEAITIRQKNETYSDALVNEPVKNTAGFNDEKTDAMFTVSRRDEYNRPIL